MSKHFSKTKGENIMSKVIIVISEVTQNVHTVDTIKQSDGETVRNFYNMDDANDWCFEYLCNKRKENNNRGLISNPEVHKTWKFGCVKDNELYYTTLTILIV